MIRRLVNNKLGIMWKEAFVAHVTVYPSIYLPGMRKAARYSLRIAGL
jgi:hypothetical protein